MANAAYSRSDHRIAGRAAAAFLQATECRRLWRRHQVDAGWRRHPRQHLQPHAHGSARSPRNGSSPEDTLLATLQYNRSEYENNWEEYSLTAGVGEFADGAGPRAHHRARVRAGRARRPTSSTAAAFSCEASSRRRRRVGRDPDRQCSDVTSERLRLYRRERQLGPQLVLLHVGRALERLLPVHARHAVERRHALGSNQTNTTEDTVVQSALGASLNASAFELRRPVRSGSDVDQLRQQRQQQDGDQPGTRLSGRQAEVRPSSPTG